MPGRFLPNIGHVIVTIASYKGGVAKTATAVHLAAGLQEKAPTLLIDGDPNRSATAWAKRGSLPFRVIDERQAARYARDFDHIIIDTPARPEPGDLEALAGGCDLLIIPTTPDALALDALLLLVADLRDLNADNYRALLTICPPRPSRDAEEARRMLEEAEVPLFDSQISRLAAFQRAALAGGTVVEQVRDRRAARGWEQYQAVMEELIR